MSRKMANCRGPSRRQFVRIGSLAALGLSELLALRQAAAASEAKKARNCILIWLDGGPSHLETFDLKPDAPQEVRGPFRPIATAVPGIQLCELLPRLAERMNHAAIVRSVTSPLGEHNLGAQYLLTGYPPSPALEYPALGCVVGHLDSRPRALPGHIAVPTFSLGGKRISGNGFLPQSARPFAVGGDPSKPNFRVQDLELYPGLDAERNQRRRGYLASLERLNDAGGGGADSSLAAAYRLIDLPEAKAALDISREPAAARARYGPRTIGQCTLLARRLVEAGVPFITVNYPGWDTHQNLYTQLKEGYTGAQVPVGLIPSLDLALSALIDDLAERRLLDETLIVVMGEFGRTPKLNAQGGRDHWPRGL
jgi:hypothetical protein